MLCEHGVHGTHTIGDIIALFRALEEQLDDEEREGGDRGIAIHEVVREIVEREACRLAQGVKDGISDPRRLQTRRHVLDYGSLQGKAIPEPRTCHNLPGRCRRRWPAVSS